MVDQLSITVVMVYVMYHHQIFHLYEILYTVRNQTSWSQLKITSNLFGGSSNQNGADYVCSVTVCLPHRMTTSVLSAWNESKRFIEYPPYIQNVFWLQIVKYVLKIFIYLEILSSPMWKCITSSRHLWPMANLGMVQRAKIIAPS